jgi:cytochrome c oxidase assembly protein subunit 15
MDTTVGRARSFELSALGFLRVALASVAALWLIVFTGAAVRLTDSGLGCRHWPGCEPGHPLPQKSYHAFIEFGNRMVGGVVLVVTLLAWLAARRTPGLPRWASRLGLAVFLGTFAQAPLGYLAVKTDLRWPIVSVHLLLSMLLVAGAVVLALEGRGLQRGHVAALVPREARLLGLGFASACLALLVSGTFATAAGPHSGGGAEHVDRFGTLNTSVYVHAAFVAAFACAFVFTLGYLMAQRRRAPRLFALGGGVLVLLLVQMGLGDLQWRTHLPWGLVLAHVALSAAVWAGVVALVTLFHRPTADVAPEAA